jgi:hypothetical protein
MEPIVYASAKLSHSGVTVFKTFENCNRPSHKNSLKNLLNVQSQQGDASCVCAVPKAERVFDDKQSRKCRKYCQKLAYYSATRKFTSKKSGKYYFKVAFLTLTAPGNAEPQQLLQAFDHFLDYLRRTANCVYVWKKELGETNKNLHFHILINNFVPYYIIAWKWKRLLLAQGVSWPQSSNGKDTTSHYRIELPRNKKLVSHYIAKYMSKAYGLPRDFGYISGHSAELDGCKEIVLTEGEFSSDEVLALKTRFYTIQDDFLCHVCCNLLQEKQIAPHLHAVFEPFYIEFSQLITLPQKFFDI